MRTFLASISLIGALLSGPVWLPLVVNAAVDPVWPSVQYVTVPAGYQLYGGASASLRCAPDGMTILLATARRPDGSFGLTAFQAALPDGMVTPAGLPADVPNRGTLAGGEDLSACRASPYGVYAVAVANSAQFVIQAVQP